MDSAGRPVVAVVNLKATKADIDRPSATLKTSADLDKPRNPRVTRAELDKPRTPTTR
jgi:hypothetical protein